MAVEPGASDHPASDLARPEERARPFPWKTALSLGSRLAAVALLGLVLVLGYRYATAHESIDPGATNAELVAILVALLGFVLALTVVVLRPERGEVRRLAWTAAIWSVALLLTLGTIWYLVNANVREEITFGTPMFDQADVDAYLASHLGPVAGDPGQQPLLIPTGVMIQSIEFLNANNVQVTGFVWQRYASTVPADVTRGFVLPEAVAEAYQADQAYTFEENGTQVIGWYIHATLRQAFDYGHYPFDRQDVWLRLWHRDFDRGVLLVPDFAAYADTDPASLPGLDEQFVYGGWDPETTAFSFATNRYNTSFGYSAVADRDSFPELYFNVGLKRDFLSPFFDHIILTLAVALLLFVILGLTTNDTELQQRFGLNTAGVVGSASALLFAVILKHSQIRSVIGSQQVAYLETLPMILYLTILLVALNAILLALPLNVKLVEYKKNILPVVAYWPFLLGVLLVTTLAVFYL